MKSSHCFKSLVFIIIEFYDFVVKNDADWQVIKNSS